MDNLLARFAVEKGKIKEKAGKAQAHPKLFEPNRQLLLSVARIEGLAFEKIKEVGTGVVKKHRSAEHLYGWARFPRNAVTGMGLEIDDDPPPCLHSNIKGWPEEAAKRKRLSQELARISEAVLLKEKISVDKDQ